MGRGLGRLEISLKINFEISDWDFWGFFFRPNVACVGVLSTLKLKSSICLRARVSEEKNKEAPTAYRMWKLIFIVESFMLLSRHVLFEELYVSFFFFF